MNKRYNTRQKRRAKLRPNPIQINDLGTTKSWKRKPSDMLNLKRSQKGKLVEVASTLEKSKVLAKVVSQTYLDK